MNARDEARAALREYETAGTDVARYHGMKRAAEALRALLSEPVADDKWEYGARDQSGRIAAYASRETAVMHAGWGRHGEADLTEQRIQDNLLRRRKAGPWEPVEAERDAT